MSTINQIIENVKKYNSNANVDVILHAYQYAAKAHEGQKRVSGEPYIVHPLEVANILTRLHMDEVSIVASLLHDVVEDTEITTEDIKKAFGEEVVLLVDGVTKLSRIEFTSKEEQQAESFRKMFLAMAKDIRVILIKLADRLHNMRTLSHLSPAKQKEIAEETMEIFAPLAHRLGISRIQWEMEDLAFGILKPVKYKELLGKIAKKRDEREAYIEKVIGAIDDKIKEAKIEAEISGRPKHFYSIYHKMIRQGKSFEEIYDLTAVRVIVGTIHDCYAVLGLVHNLWKPIPGRFKDYIAMPKTNLYQSLHTTVIGPQGEPVEIQIRTWEMHYIAEYGIAAHWTYKEGNKQVEYAERLSWLRQLLEWQQDLRDAHEYMEALKIDLFVDEVFVFTPKGKVIDLPTGSTAIDFAYRIHTDIGNYCVGSKVNGKMVSLNYKLQNGDIVEVLTSKQSKGPSRDWLGIVKTSQARSRIKQWFKRKKREENIINGRELLEKEINRMGFKPKDLIVPEEMNKVTKRFNLQTEEDVFAAIGYGGLTPHQVTNRLADTWKKKEKKNEIPETVMHPETVKVQPKPKERSSKGVVVKGVDDALVKLARCCNPVPGDDIVGYITRGRGVSVHRKDCPNVTALLDNPERFMEVVWEEEEDGSYVVDIEVMAMDRSALLKDITQVLADMKVYIRSATVRTVRNRVGIIALGIVVNDLQHLDRVIQKLKQVKDVFSIRRATPS